MNKKLTIFQTAMTALVISALSATAQVADERPTRRRFQEVIHKISEELNEAKVVVDRDQARLAETGERDAPTDELVAERAEKIKALREAREAYQEEKKPKNEAALQEALLDTAKVSTDVLERIKNEIVIGIEMVDEVRDKFASVQLMFEELEILVEDLGLADTPEQRQAIREQEDRIYSVLKMTDSLSNIGVDDPETKRILSTIETIADRINAGEQQNVNIQRRLNEQRKNIEHLFAQLSVVRTRLEMQKQQVIQLTLGQIVHNMLLKLSGTMLAAVDVNDLPVALMEQAAQRDQHVKAIQNQNMGLYDTGGSTVGDRKSFSNIERIRREREPDL